MPFVEAKRYASHLFWVLSNQALVVGPIRFVLFPLVAYFIGTEEFGALVTAQGVVLMLGVAPAQGLAAGLFRHVFNYPDALHPRFYSTALRLCHRAMLVIVLIGAASVILVGWVGAAPWLVLLCLLPMTLSLYPENQYLLTLSELRVNRRFTSRTVQEGMRAILLLAGGLLGMLVGGVVGVACGLAAGNTIAYVLVRRQRRAWFVEPFDAEMATKLKAIWFFMTLATIFALSGQYLVRILLSYWNSLADVSVLYGASSILTLFLIPVGCSGALVLSMLARYGSFAELSRRAKGYLLLLVLGAAVGTPLAIFLGGPIVLRAMFPKFAEQSLPLLHILLWAGPFACLKFLLKPLVIKFGTVWHVPVIDGVSMAAFSLPCLLLIPRYGVHGAAWGLLVGHAVTGLLWLALSFPVFLSSSVLAKAAGSIDPDPGAS